MPRNGNTNITPINDTIEFTGAGGWCTGAHYLPDGSMIERFDTTIPYSKTAAGVRHVREFIAGVTIAAADVQSSLNNAPAATACYSQPGHKYAIAGGWLWRKRPGETQYTKTAWPRNLTLNANDKTRMNGHWLEVDPNNPEVIWVGTPDRGIEYSLDGGVTWTSIPTSTIPLPADYIDGDGIHHKTKYSIRFDRSGPVVGTGASARTQRIYIHCSGPTSTGNRGVYKHIAAGVGAGWTFMIGSQANAGCLKVSPLNGWIIQSGTCLEIDGNVSVYDGTIWTTGSRGGSGNIQLKAVVFSAQHAGRVYGVQSGSGYTVSSDGGKTWSAEYLYPVSTPQTLDVPWMIRDNGISRSVSDIDENPLADQLSIWCGVGHYVIDNPPASTSYGQALTLRGFSRGLENMVNELSAFHPDSSYGSTMQDKQFMLYEAKEVGKIFANNHGPLQSIAIGTSFGWSPTNSSIIAVAYQQNGGEHFGLTTDRGKTWTTRNNIVTATGGNGSGQLIMLSDNCIVFGQRLAGGFPMTSANRAKNTLRISFDRGVAHQELLIGNGNAVNSMYQAYDARQVFAQDWNNPGTFTYYNCADLEAPTSADSQSCGGYWKIVVDLANSTITSVTKTANRLAAALVPGQGNQDGFNLKNKSGLETGTFFVAGGNGSLGLWKHANYGQTRTEVTGTDNLGIGTRFGEVYAFAIGAKRWNSNFPTIYVMGHRISADFYSGDDWTNWTGYGLWISHDGGSTWTREMQFPSGNFTKPNDLAADPNVYKKLVASYPGQGSWAYYEEKLVNAS